MVGIFSQCFCVANFVCFAQVPEGFTISGDATARPAAAAAPAAAATGGGAAAATAENGGANGSASTAGTVYIASNHADCRWHITFGTNVEHCRYQNH